MQHGIRPAHLAPTDLVRMDRFQAAHAQIESWAVVSHVPDCAAGRAQPARASLPVAAVRGLVFFAGSASPQPIDVVRSQHPTSARP